MTKVKSKSTSLESVSPQHQETLKGDTPNTSEATPSSETAVVDKPVFKTWHIERLEDIAAVDAWQMDKCLYFLAHVIRSCRIQKRALLSMTYHEQGKIVYVMRDLETGEIYTMPPPENAPIREEPAAAIVEDEEDPLA